MTIHKAYLLAREQYAAYGIDTTRALKQLAAIRLSLHCWQGDDVAGFEPRRGNLGGVLPTGNYPGRARTPEELRTDLAKALSLIPAAACQSHAPSMRKQARPAVAMSWRHNISPTGWPGRAQLVWISTGLSFLIRWPNPGAPCPTRIGPSAGLTTPALPPDRRVYGTPTENTLCDQHLGAGWIQGHTGGPQGAARAVAPVIGQNLQGAISSGSESGRAGRQVFGLGRKPTLSARTIFIWLTRSRITTVMHGYGPFAIPRIGGRQVVGGAFPAGSGVFACQPRCALGRSCRDPHGISAPWRKLCAVIICRASISGWTFLMPASIGLPHGSLAPAPCSKPC